MRARAGADLTTMWPFTKRTEHRAAYSDAVVQAIVNQAAGGTAVNPYATASLEACAGLVGRAFAAAEVVSDSSAVRAAIPPETLNLVGRSLIRRGELVLYIDVDGAGVVNLLPCASYDISGGASKDTWKYRCDVAGPSRTQTKRAYFRGRSSLPVCGRSVKAMAWERTPAGGCPGGGIECGACRSSKR